MMDSKKEQLLREIETIEIQLKSLYSLKNQYEKLDKTAEDILNI